MTPLIILVAVVGLIAWGVVASRRTSENKKEAMADLKLQQEQIEPFDIQALVTAEIADLGLRSIPGAAGVPAAVLLKTWKDNVETVNNCPSRDLLSFVVTPGLDPSEALDSDVSLVCDADTMVTPDVTPDVTPEASAGGQPEAESNTADLTDDRESE
jgi:hypothetical protein